MARRGGFEFQPWHALAVGGALLGYVLLSGSGRRGPRLSFPGPAEDYAPLEDENMCDPRERAGTSLFRRFVLRNFGGTDLGIVRGCADAPSGHYAGKSWDWGIDGANVEGLFRYLFENEHENLRRAGLTYAIYNGRIWNARSRRWQDYTGRNPHTDHVHFSFGTPGSLGQTSFYQASGIA